MLRTEFKNWLIKAVEDFDKTIDSFADMPEKLQPEEWFEQFQYYINNIMDKQKGNKND